jgi:hypothetical protein
MSNALQANYRLDEYVIQSVLGHGGFGITYLARDTRLGALVAIKEYFPQAYAVRDRTNTIRPNTGGDTADVENYRWGLQEFLKEARALAQFKHANIVRVLRFLEGNGTAYMVMEYEEGESLSDHLARHGGFLSEPLLLNIFLPVLTGLQAVHDAGLLHLDIKPDNIYLRRSGPPMLIDFGAARQRSGSDRSEKVALTPGYAALEQYPARGDLGPWSDVYSIGATLYRCITGKEPIDSRDRERGLNKLHIDPLVPATRFDRPRYSPHIRECIDRAMALNAAERPRTAFALQNGLMGKDMNAARPASAASAYSRGAGFIGIVAAEKTDKRRRLIPRGPLERLLVFVVFLAVLVVAPVRIMLATNLLTEDQLYAFIDRLRGDSSEAGMQATRFFEEKLLGIKRPPEYVPSASIATARPGPLPKRDAPPAVPPFETGKQLAVTVATSAPVASLAFLQDGTRIAAALDDGTIELRDAETGARLQTLLHGTGHPGAVAASADGQLLAFSGDNDGIEIWDMKQNVFLTELPGHDDAVIALGFSPDGELLASIGRDQSAILWDVATGKMILDLSKPACEPLSLAFSPDGNRLAIGDAGGGIRYWELAARHEIAYVPTGDLPIDALAYSPDGKNFAVGGEHGLLNLWDLSGQRPDRSLDGAPDTVLALTFTPDSKWLVVAGSDSALQLWSVEHGRMAQQYAGGNHQTYALAVAPQGREIAAAGIDDKLTLWR